MIGAVGDNFGLSIGLVPPSPSGDVEASGETSKAMAALKDMLSESATFQDAIGATGDAAAKKAWALSRIHLAEYLRDDDEEAGFARPFGLIMTPGGDTGRAIATGHFVNSGLLDLWVEQEIPEAYQAANQAHNAEMYFKNFLDGITSDCAALSSQAGYLMVQSMTMPEGPGRIDEINVKAYACRIAVAWGLE